MLHLRAAVLLVLPAFSAVLTAQAPTTPASVPAPPPPSAVARYIKIPAADRGIYLQHVRIIDGTGAAALENQTILIENGKISSIATTGYDQLTRSGAIVLDLTGRTVIPGIVGMHDHMYGIARPNADAEGHSEPPLVVPQMTFTSPHLYLGAGVTTLRTTGSVEPYTDLNLKAQIDAGKLPGPHMDVTAPYLEGANSPFIQMHQLKNAEDARATVDFWAAQGATSFKAYMNITRAELKAAIDEAHKLGLNSPAISAPSPTPRPPPSASTTSSTASSSTPSSTPASSRIPAPPPPGAPPSPACPPAPPRPPPSSSCS